MRRLKRGVGSKRMTRIETTGLAPSVLHGAAVSGAMAPHKFRTSSTSAYLQRLDAGPSDAAPSEDAPPPEDDVYLRSSAVPEISSRVRTRACFCSSAR